jgi:hypothetical protein
MATKGNTRLYLIGLASVASIASLASSADADPRDGVARVDRTTVILSEKDMSAKRAANLLKNKNVQEALRKSADTSSSASNSQDKFCDCGHHKKFRVNEWAGIIYRDGKGKVKVVRQRMAGIVHVSTYSQMWAKIIKKDKKAKLLATLHSHPTPGATYCEVGDSRTLVWGLSKHDREAFKSNPKILGAVHFMVQRSWWTGSYWIYTMIRYPNGYGGTAVYEPAPHVL